MKTGFNYTIQTKLPGSLARAGTITTPHGIINTPAFIAVGTKATVKALTPEQILSTGAQAVLANAYHLYLQPGEKIIAESGGLGNFMNWHKPTFTDSGGFQVLSLGVGFKKVITMDARADEKIATAKSGERLAKVDDDGVNFKSHINGSTHRFTPEKSMQIQHSIGADIIFAFDECTSIAQPYSYHKTSLNRTHGWALRCIKEHKKLTNIHKNRPYQALFGVIQGANYKNLRQEASKYMASLNFDGFGIGGALEKERLADIVGWVNNILPENKPRHLLGLSEPDDIFIGIEYGADTFDCVSPARIGRNGSLYTDYGRFTIKKSLYANDFSAVVEGCNCYTCSNYSKAYLHHLFRAKERLSATLATIHNEYFIVNLVEKIRLSIIDNSFNELKNQWLNNYYGSKHLT